MNIGILNEKLGIMVIDSLDDLGYIQTQQMKELLPDGAVINDLAFFYMPDRDWVVINKSHALYEFYSQIIPTYLELSERSRKECIAEAPTATVKSAFRILDGVICNRALIYGKVV